MARTTIRASQVNEDTLQDADNDTKVQVEESADEDKIRFDTAGTERMIIDNTGKIGIGISSPDTLIHLKGTAPTITLQRDNNSNDSSMINFEGASGVVACQVGQVAGQDNELAFSTHNGSNLLERMRIDNAGKVGIGTTAPGEMLEVNGNIKGSDSLYVDKIREAGNSGTTTKIKLEPNAIEFYAGGNSSDQVCTVDATGLTVDIGKVYIKNTIDDGTTNRTMIRLHNYRTDDAEINDWAPTSIDFDIENGGGQYGGTARITAVLAPQGTDPQTTAGEQSTALIFSTMNDNTLSEALRIDHKGAIGKGNAAALSVEDGGYLKIHAGVKYSRGVKASSAISPAGDSNPNKDGGWIKFASATPSGASNLDVTAASFLITIAGQESSSNRRLDGTFLVHAKYTNNNAGTGDSIVGQYYESEGTFIYCEPLNADFLSATGSHSPIDFDPATDLLMIFTDSDSTAVVDLYIKACAKDKHCFVTHLGGTGNIDTSISDPGFSINTDQSYSVTEPAAPGGSVKKTGTWASKVFSNVTIKDVLVVKDTLETKAMKVNVRDVNSTSTIQATDYVLRCIQNSAITLTLPAKSGNTGQVLIFKDMNGNAATNNITLDGNASETIDGSATYVINNNRESITLTCDGINGWIITSRVRP